MPPYNYYLTILNSTAPLAKRTQAKESGRKNTHTALNSPRRSALILFGNLGLVALLAEPFHKGNALVGDQRPVITTTHIAGTFGREPNTKAGDLVATDLLLGGDTIARRQSCVSEPTYALQVNRPALFHEIGHHLGHGPDHGMHIGRRDGTLAGQTFRELLRLDRIADRYAAWVPLIINSCLNSFPKNHGIK